MADSVRAAVRDRVHLRSILAWCGLVAFLFWLFDGTVVQIGTTLVSGVFVGLTDVFDEVYGLRSRVRSLGVGLVALLSGIGLLALGGDALWLPVVFIAVGGWIVLDAVQTLRHEGATTDDETPDGRDVYHDYVTRQVDRTLREQPLTRRELLDVLDPDNAAIDRALAELDNRGLLVRQGSELRTESPPEPGGVARARRLATTAAARLARPLTVEFESESSTDDADGTDHHGLVAERVERGSRSDDDRERERESAGRR